MADTMKTVMPGRPARDIATPTLPQQDLDVVNLTGGSRIDRVFHSLLDSERVYEKCIGWVEPRFLVARPTKAAVFGGPHAALRRSTHPTTGFSYTR